MRPSPPFERALASIVGNEEAKLALLLNLIEPKCGGVLLVGGRGSGKSELLRFFGLLLKGLGIPCVEIPLNVTREQLLGEVDLEESLRLGRRVYKRGLLSLAKGGFLLVDDIGLFEMDRLALIFFEADVVPIGALNPAEGTLPPHFLDRFGMCASMEGLDDPERRKAVIKAALRPGFEGDGFKAALEEVRRRLGQVRWDDGVLLSIATLCSGYGVRSNRAEAFLFYAAKALSALQGDPMITEDHIEAVAPLVLRHRANEEREVQPPQPQEEPQGRSEEKGGEEKKGGKEQKPPSSGRNGQGEGPIGTHGGSMEERVFEIGEVFRVRSLSFKKDRILRPLSGRRTLSKSSLKGGRFVRSVSFSLDRDLDIFGTIKAAAPFQKLRGANGRLIVKEEDLRFKEKERKIGHLFLFVVDGSGSMGIQQRMAAVKGALLSLVVDCYQKRDRVAMVLFRGRGAEVLIPPTSSPGLVYRKIREIPTGGKTPLGHGLLEAYRLAVAYQRKNPHARVVLLLVTDGRANVPLKDGSDPFAEIRSLSAEVARLPFVDPVVVDSEPNGRFLMMGLAQDLARWMGASYMRLEDLRAWGSAERGLQRP